MRMKDVKKFLLEHPDERFEIVDDTECKAFLMQFGLLDQFNQFKTDYKEPKQQVALHYIQSHYIVAVLFSGMQKPEDNGYMVHCFPKSKFTQKQFEDIVQNHFGLNPNKIEGFIPEPKRDTGSN